MLHPGAEFTGRLFVEEIGFPRELLNSESLKTGTVEKEAMSMLIPERPANSYKGDYGHALVIAGSRGKTGAALMTSRACLRTGAGMVTIGIPETLSDIFQGRVTEEMVLPLPDDGRGMLSPEALGPILNFVSQKADVIAIGPGIGVSDATRRMMTELIMTSPVPLVIDADGLNSLAGAKDVLKKAKSPLILTPHTGEMARLLRQKTENEDDISEIIADISRDRINTTVSFSKDTGIYLVLKGAPTIIAEPGGKVLINTTGNPGMASAGSGDVLTGMISALLGQGLNPLDASVLGTYMHGMGGDIAASEKGMHSMIATDIIEKIPNAFAALKIR
jgi:NAD(P)H-hydrate epimerase